MLTTWAPVSAATRSTRPGSISAMVRRAPSLQLKSQIATDGANALDGDVQARQIAAVLAAKDDFGHRLDAAAAAERSERRRIARAALRGRGARTWRVCLRTTSISLVEVPESSQVR